MVNSARLPSISQELVAMSRNQFEPCMSLMWLSLKQRQKLAFALVCFAIGLIKLAPLGHSIRSQTNTKNDQLTHYFLRFASGITLPRSFHTKFLRQNLWQREFNLSSGSKARKKLSAKARLCILLLPIIFCGVFFLIAPTSSMEFQVI